MRNGLERHDHVKYVCMVNVKALPEEGQHETGLSAARPPNHAADLTPL